MTDERTSLFAEARPGPSYVFPGRQPRNQQRQVRQFQCCICASFLSILVIVLVITIAYSLSNDESNDVSTESPATPWTNKTIRPSRALNESEIYGLLLFATWPITDEPPHKWAMDVPDEVQIKNAIYAGIKALGDKELLEENIDSPALNTPSYRHQRAVSTTLEARVLTKRGYVENQATIEIFKNHTKKKPSDQWNIGKGPAINLDQPDKRTVCNFNSKYRNSNGTCNNKENPLTYGVAMRPFRRSLNPDYADGINAPRRTRTNEPLPSSRMISLGVHRPSYSTDPHFTVMLAVFGQFLDHDITATALNQAQDGRPIDCCVDKSIVRHPECFPVYSGAGDPNYDNFNISCMSFVRSAPAPTGYFGPRQQLNQATAYIDGSVVYGTLDDRVQRLRSSKNGLLRMYNTPDNRTLLPVSTDPNDGCNEAAMNAKGKYCFESGDTRSNENLHLTSMHLIWARHHNNIANNLEELNPDWDDEIIFQESKKILAAQLQHITYNEFLPMLLGEQFTEQIGIRSNPASTRDTYDPTVDASIANVFAACAFRFAHTLLPGLMKITKDPNTTESIELHRMLFNPYSLWADGGLDTALGSAIHTPLAKSDQFFTTELTEKLFQNNISESKPKTRKTVGLDLVSLNVQRGRDHGLPSYTVWRKFCNLPSADTWEEMSHAVDADSLTSMKSIYKNAVDVDLYTGALSEPPMQGAISGPLLSCLISDQFLRIKKGDSFWYERKIGSQRFTKMQLEQIYNSTLAAIICRNSDAVEYSQPYVMRKVSTDNEITKCSLLDTFDFSPWKLYAENNKFNKFVKISNSQLNVLNFIDDGKNGSVQEQPTVL